ncbi:RICIN domain-containing protein [Streptomyces phaeochromogenes]|uniref:RICIN domain-containing protein n=1 Tax=Streptomyces phaeochromogenes TaxID=1923 RepID=UPI0033D922B4
MPRFSGSPRRTASSSPTSSPGPRAAPCRSPTALGGGAYRLTNRQSGKALDNANIGTEGSTVIQWFANGGSPQQWNMTRLS